MLFLVPKNECYSCTARITSSKEQGRAETTTQMQMNAKEVTPPTLACGKNLLLMVDRKVNLRTVSLKMSAVSEIFDTFRRVIPLHSKNQALRVLKDVPNLHQAGEMRSNFIERLAVVLSFQENTALGNLSSKPKFSD